MNNSLVEVSPTGDVDRTSYSIKIEHRCSKGEIINFTTGLGPFREAQTTVTCPICKELIVVHKNVSHPDVIYLANRAVVQV